MILFRSHGTNDHSLNPYEGPSSPSSQHTDTSVLIPSPPDLPFLLIQFFVTFFYPFYLVG